MSVVRAEIGKGESLAIEQSRWASSRPLRGLVLVLQLAILLAAVYFTCYRNLGVESLYTPDEHIHIRVTQEMRSSGHWWAPTLHGEPYYHKPPFKMWLSFIPLELLGESKFSYRVLDATAAAATTLLIFFFVSAVFASSFAGLIAALALLGCQTYLFVHVARYAVQDSMMVLLFCAAMFFGRQFVQSVSSASRKELFWLAAGGGLAVALSVMTKSVAGYLPLVLIFFYALLCGRLSLIWQKAKLPALLVVVIAIALPALYYVPHLLSSATARLVILKQEITKRVLTGYHHQDEPFYYLKTTFLDRRNVPPIPLAAGLGLAIVCAVRKRDERYLFLLCWAVGTVFIYSCFQSRVEHYIASAFPAFAMLVGVLSQKVLLAGWRSLLEWWNGVRRFSAPALASFILGVYSIAAVGFHFREAAIKVAAPTAPILLDTVVEDILAFYRASSSSAPILVVDDPFYGGLEAPVWGMVESRFVPATLTEAKALSKEKSPAFAMSRLGNMHELMKLGEVHGYQFLRPTVERASWSVVVAYDEGFSGKHFKSEKTLIDFGTRELDVLHGFASGGRMNTLRVRRTKGPHSAMRVSGDYALNTFGTDLFINVQIPSGISARVLLNSVKLGELKSRGASMYTAELEVPPGVWRKGDNVIFFEAQRSDGKVISADEQPLLFNWMSIRLRQASGVEQ